MNPNFTGLEKLPRKSAKKKKESFPSESAPNNLRFPKED
jgi:hypothetical protein